MSAPSFIFVQVPIPLKPKESYERKHIRKRCDVFLLCIGRKDQASKSPKCCLVLAEMHLFCARETWSAHQRDMNSNTEGNLLNVMGDFIKLSLEFCLQAES